MKQELNEAIEAYEQPEDVYGQVSVPLMWLVELKTTWETIRIILTWAKIITGPKGDRIIEKAISIGDSLTGLANKE